MDLIMELCRDLVKDLFRDIVKNLVKDLGGARQTEANPREKGPRRGGAGAGRARGRGGAARRGRRPSWRRRLGRCGGRAAAPPAARLSPKSGGGPASLQWCSFCEHTCVRWVVRREREHGAQHRYLFQFRTVAYSCMSGYVPRRPAHTRPPPPAPLPTLPPLQGKALFKLRPSLN